MKKLFLSLLTVSTFFFGTSQAQVFDIPCLKDQSQESCHTVKPPFVTPLNTYEVMLTVGQDEVLPQSALNVSLEGFQNLGWNAATIEDFRQAAISWFITRFGVDFSSGTYDPSTGTTTTSFGIMIPVDFTGNYRVLGSNTSLIPSKPVCSPPAISASEFVVVFFPNASSMNYGGTYGAGQTLPINTTNTLNFGIYQIAVKAPRTLGQCKRTRNYLIYTRAYYPSTLQIGAENLNPQLLLDTSQLYSPDFGPGAAFLNVGTPSAPNGDGTWTQFVRGTFFFPGSYALPYLNGFTSAPINLN